MYVVFVSGGIVCLLVVNGYYNMVLVWLFDSKLLVYGVDLYGNNDVFVVFVVGGFLWWLMIYFVVELFVVFILDGKLVLFSV